jgi:O-antigen/teichoic acid export membrane protein
MSRGGAFVRLFGSAVVMQALLSAASFVVGLILIRRTADSQYAYYILVSNAVLLLTSLQFAFVQPQMVSRMVRLGIVERQRLIGGLYRDQRRLWLLIGAVSGMTIIVLYVTGVLAGAYALVMFAAIAAGTASLFRDFFRMVLLAHRRPDDVVRADLVFVALLVAGVMLATLTSAPAATAALALGLASLAGGWVLARILWRHEPWQIDGAAGILRTIAPLGMWSAAGAGVHWLFSHGYNYLVAGTLNIAAVAALAATRQLMMPVSLLSTGIGALMLPTVSGWLNQHGPQTVLRRLLLIAGGLSFAVICYFLILWIFRDWTFTYVLKKQIAHRDELLLLWLGVFILIVMRDQLLYLPLACARFRHLLALTCVCAVAALTISYTAMTRMGVIGVPIGVMVGELINVAGLIALSMRETRRRPEARLTNRDLHDEANRQAVNP